jgi:hypothetical protein
MKIKYAVQAVPFKNEADGILIYPTDAPWDSSTGEKDDLPPPEITAGRILSIEEAKALREALRLAIIEIGGKADEDRLWWKTYRLMLQIRMQSNGNSATSVLEKAHADATAFANRLHGER